MITFSILKRDKSKSTRVKKEFFKLDQQDHSAKTVKRPIKFIEDEVKMVEGKLKLLEE